MHAAAEEDSITPCLACTGDFQPIAPNAVVPAEGRQLLGVFHLASGDSFSRLVSTWIAVDVGQAAPPNYKVAEASIDLAGRHEGKFHFTLPRALPLGRYRLDVTADGKPWRSAEITVAQSSPLTAPPATPLIPLIEGREWTYDFTQEGGPGVTIDLPGATKDAAGRLHVTLVMTADRVDDHGTHLTLVRNGEKASEEWWRLDDRGLVATQRAVQGQEVVLDPPQTLLARPESTYQEWDYTAADGSYRQHCRQWCLNAGSAPGTAREFLVVQIVGERHFILGTGLVREVITATVGGRLINRTTMVLRGSGSGA